MMRRNSALERSAKENSSNHLTSIPPTPSPSSSSQVTPNSVSAGSPNILHGNHDTQQTFTPPPVCHRRQRYFLVNSNS